MDYNTSKRYCPHEINTKVHYVNYTEKLVREKGYTRNPGSLYRMFVRLGYRRRTVLTKEKNVITRHRTHRNF